MKLKGGSGWSLKNIIRELQVDLVLRVQKELMEDSLGEVDEGLQD